MASVLLVIRRTSSPVVASLSALIIAACGGGGPDIGGDLSANELAAKLPSDGIAQAVAVDVDAAKEAAGLPADADPASLGTNPNELRFATSAFFAFQSLSLRTENPVRSALDHSAISAYAAQPASANDSVTLVSTTQSFDDIASSLEADEWEREGDVLSTDEDPATLGYTAVGGSDGFLVLGNDPGLVEAVASGEAEPSETGELEALEQLDAPVTAAIVPEVEGLECVEMITFEDTVDGLASMDVTVTGGADADGFSKQLRQDSASAGFTVASIEAEGDTATVELEGRDEEGLANTPALLIGAGFDDTGDLLYDCG